MITATKKKGGWEAEDQFPFMGARRLSIRTYKFAGKLTTWAAVNKYYDGGYEHAFGLGAAATSASARSRAIRSRAREDGGRPARESTCDAARDHGARAGALREVSAEGLTWSRNEFW
jgi:hypothetical protein